MLFIIFSYEHTETYEHEDTKQTFPDIQEHLGEHQLKDNQDYTVLEQKSVQFESFFFFPMLYLDSSVHSPFSL